MIYPDLPLKALSIRQPWCWGILYGGKPVENRPRKTNFRGRVAIHASSFGFGSINIDMLSDWEFVQENCPKGISVPKLRDLPYGGIVGSVEITDCVTKSDSSWFFGTYGYVLHDPQPCDFIAVKGMLGLFDWRARL